MINLNYISGFFPESLRTNPEFLKHIVKEYIQLMVLDYLSSTRYSKKLTFIGGTNLRLVKGIDRWSEDLDFDIKGMAKEEFMEMTDDVAKFLQNSGLRVVVKDKDSTKLSAFRRNIYFPNFLYDLKLTGHPDERFLLKIEAQDQNVAYEPKTVNVEGCGFYFPLLVPPDEVLLSMKFSALLSRAKGRDFYDVMFLLAQTEPDYEFLKVKDGIASAEQLKESLVEKLKTVDLELKQRDFSHLLFNEKGSEKIKLFPDFIMQKL